MQIGVAHIQNQFVGKEHLAVSPDLLLSYVDAEEAVGSRVVFHAENRFEFAYEAEVQINRSPANIETTAQLPATDMPSEVVKYLMPSRYCNPDYFEEIVPAQFGQLSGGALILAISDWLHSNFEYVAGASHTDTTATDSFNSGKGVCRDYAHVLIAMARAAAVPARMVSAYAPRVAPQDFHAVAEVYLDGKWHLIDPTNMSKAEEIAIIGVGRDAADVSFLTSFGAVEFNNLSVSVVPF